MMTRDEMIAQLQELPNLEVRVEIDERYFTVIRLSTDDKHAVYIESDLTLY